MRPSRSGKPRVSMRVRLTFWVMAIYAVIHWSTGLVLWLYQTTTINRVFDERLIERAEALAAPVAARVPGIDRTRLNEFAVEQARFMRFETFVIDVLRPDGTPAVEGGSALFDPAVIPTRSLLASGRATLLRLPSDAVGTEATAMLRLPTGGSDVQTRAVAMVMLGADLEPYILVVATTDEFARSQLMLVLQIFTISALLGPLAAGLSGWFIAGIAVAPFERLRGLAADFGPESLDHVIELPTSNREVADLTRQLDEARKKINAAFNEQRQFLMNVSHELKTPIAVVLIEAQMLDRGEMSSDVRSFVESTREEMSRLGKLVESFLLLARLQRGHEAVAGRRTPVNEIIMEAIEHSSQTAEQAGVRLSAELLDEESDDSELLGEPELLRTMVDNLLRNAVRFTTRGGLIRVDARVVGQSVEIRVSDEGPCIPPEDLEKIFHDFAQSGAEHGRGHGLGLAISRGVAEMHGGRLEATNHESGRGCVFTITLPLAGAADRDLSSSDERR